MAMVIMANSSLPMPSHFAEAPVAMITASAEYSPWSVESRKGRLRRSALSTVSGLTVVPNRRTCSRISSIRAGPAMPWRKPG